MNGKKPFFCVVIPMFNEEAGAVRCVEEVSRALQGLNDTIVRRLSEDADLDLLAALVDRPELEERARALDVWSRPLPVLLSGAELVGLGVPAGPKMGDLLARLREAQIEGDLSTPADARAWVQSIGLAD